jgi:serine/threonine protein kinase
VGDQPKDELALGGTLAAEPAHSDTLAAKNPEPTEAIAAGARLGGRYQVIRLLGEGGMGAVYLASDEVLGKQVALKFVHTRLRDRLDTLRDEVLLAQKVTHRHVCRTYDLEEVDGRYLVKMEYVAGETLADKVAREKRLSVAEALAIARSIVEGLEAAHAAGVVHRDLKPRNVLLEEGSGRVVLMDFGIARTTAPTGQTADDGISGTPEYMAPEQVRAQKVDGRTDLYALGCLLYQLVVGEVPFPADTPMACALRQVEDAPTDPRLRRPETPPWLARLILDLLKKDPALRPANAGEVLQRLKGPQPRSRRALVGVGLLVLAVVVGVGASRFPKRNEWRPVVRELPSEFEENTGNPVLSPDGKQVAFASDRLDRETGQWNLFVEDLATHKARQLPVTNALELRWSRDGKSLLYRNDVKEAFRLPLDDPKPVAIGTDIASLDDCGGRLAVVRCSDAGCRVALLSPDRDLFPPRPAVRIEGLHCDPAGRNVVYWTDPHPPTVSLDAPFEIWTAPLDGGPPRQLVPSGPGNHTPSFSADGRTVIFSALVEDQRNLFEVPVTGGAPRRLTLGEGPHFDGVASSDGKFLLYDLDTTIGTILVRRGSERPRRITTRHDELKHPQLTRDGKSLLAELFNHGRPQVALYALDGNAAPRILGDGAFPHPTQDGREVLAIRQSPGRGQVVALPLSGGPERVLTEVDGIVGWLDQLWDGMVYLSVFRGSNELSVWKLPLSGGTPTSARIGSHHSVMELAGGWRIANTSDAMRVLKPGAMLEGPAVRTISTERFGWSGDGRTLWYVAGAEVHRYRIALDEDTVLPGGAPLMTDLALSNDGETVYYSGVAGTVRRMMITNFADRP